MNSNRTYSIFVVDDDPVICSLLEDFLIFKNTKVSTFKSWAEAKLAISTHVYPDIILIDLQMPEVDGIKALEDLEELYPNNSIIKMLMSANEDSDRLLKNTKFKISAIIKKPFEISVLRESISKALET